MEFELVIREGQQPGRRYSVAPGAKITVGRALQCDIQLPDKGVSRQHCSIECVGALLRVRDLESANGTYINGHPIETGTVAVGDQLGVGPTVLDCLAKGTEPETAQRDARFAFEEDSTTTVVRKVVDTGSSTSSAGVTPRPDDVKDLMRTQKNFGAAYQVSKMLASVSTLDGVIDGVLESIFQTIQADRAALLLQKDAMTDEFEVVAARTRKSRHEPGEISVSRTVVKDVLENGVSTLSRDASSDARFREGQSIIQANIRSVMCTPIGTDDRVLGVLYADSRSLVDAFTESDLELLALIGNQAGLGIHRVQLKAELEEFFFDTIRAIVATIDAKDGYTHRHSERVAALGVRIARELGQGPAELELVKHAGLLHDVGKIGVAGNVLNKPGELTREEFEEVKKHSLYGVRILEHIKNPKIEAILPGVRHHHEKWDGSGYPDGLAGKAIPILGRILAVADVFDALRSNRPYREAIALDKSIEIIKESAGTHFDAEIAAAAVSLHQRGELEGARDLIQTGGTMLQSGPSLGA